MGATLTFVILLFLSLPHIGVANEQRPAVLFQGTAVFVAVFSIFITAISSIITISRAKRLQTLTAWSNWFDTTKDDRLRIIRHFSGQQPTFMEVELLTTPAKRTPENLAVSSFGDKNELEDIKRKIMEVLSGLERIAVGVEEGIYDVDTLRRIGGSSIIRYHDRFDDYIQYLQTHPDKNIRQERAYKSFAQMAAEIKEQNDKIIRKERAKRADREALRRRY
ncbi:DUF4760 domain-containing protein [Kocuria marina]|uniref:DUF4760 domain-containing protein n=1 Tax=Kocuria marina TaxID=223184 RepID=UPI003460FC59